TSPRRSVECVPARWLAWYINTTSCSSCLLILPPNSAGSTSTVPTFSPWRLYTSRVIMVYFFPGKKPHPSPGLRARCPLSMIRVPSLAGRHPLAFGRSGCDEGSEPAADHGEQTGAVPDTGRKKVPGTVTAGFPAPCSSHGSRAGERRHLDLDIDARRQGQALVEGLDGLAGRLEDVDQALVRANLK